MNEKLENLTPTDLRCPWGQCPGAYKREDGQIVIVGKKGDAYNTVCNVGDGEYAIVIHPKYLVDVVK